MYRTIPTIALAALLSCASQNLAAPQSAAPHGQAPRASLDVRIAGPEFSGRRQWAQLPAEIGLVHRFGFSDSLVGSVGMRELYPTESHLPYAIQIASIQRGDTIDVELTPYGESSHRFSLQPNEYTTIEFGTMHVGDRCLDFRATVARP